jgi:Tfp pilus assembly protein PilO
MPGRSAHRRSWRTDAVGSGFCAAMTIAAYLITINPIIRSESERAGMQSHVEEQARRVMSLDESRERLGKQLDEVREQVAASHVQLQSSEFLNSRLALIIELASTSGIEIYQSRPGRMIDTPRYQAVPISLSGAGSFTDCAAFLHRLHETLGDTGVVAFELTGKPEAPNTTASFRFELVWYAAPPQASRPL